MMKKNLLLFTLVFTMAFRLLNAQAPSLQWARSFGGTANENTSDIISIGNYVFMTGSFGTTVDFDPGPGLASHTSNGNIDIYISCFDRDGNFIWANAFGSINGDAGKGLYSDGTYLYATGYYSLTIDCDPGPGTVNLTSAGGTDVYICKYDLATGALIWAKSVGGTSDDIGTGISGDNLKVCIGGTFQLTADFNPGPGTNNLTSAGSTDNFVVALDPGSNYLWAGRFGNTGGETVSGVSSDPSGGVCILGAFSGINDFDPGAGTYNLTSNGGSLDFYVLRLNGSGSFSWAVNAGGTGSDNALDIAIDQASGFIYVGGYFQSTCDFDPGPGTDNHSSMGSNDIFLLTLNGSGNYVNAFTLGGTGSDLARALTIDQGRIYLAGGFNGTVDFDPGPGVQNLVGPGGYVLATDLSGNYVWAGMMGDVTTQFYSIAADNAGSIYPTGPFQNTGDFDPGPGVYNLTSNGLNDAVVLRLNFCPVVTLTISSQSPATCFGAADGSATVSASGGTTFTYSWAPAGGNGATASGLSAGTYTCTVTNECSGSNTITVTINQPPALSAASSATAILCNGGTSTITVVASGGTSPYSGTGTSTVSAGGPYSYTVTDNNGCTSTTTITVTQPSALSASSSQNNVSCNGGSNGSATVTASGGTPAYTYSWAPAGGTAATAAGLAAGTYTCTITDANSCTTTQTFNITAPAALSVTASSQTNISCNSGSNGAASVTVSGGTTAYSYDWTPGNPTGDGTASVTGLTAGTWTCTVTDANSCVATQTFNITQPSALVASAASQTNISCNGGSNGAASVTVSGGTTAYSYDWTPGNPTGDGTASVTGLAAGTWTCTVTDANSCVATQTFNITQPAALSVSAASQTNVSCDGGSNGAASVTVSGGTTAYSYNWTPGNPTGDGTASVTGLTAGTWTCTVTDANSCVTTQTFNITQPTALSVSAASQTNVSCDGGSNGAASINTPTGGAGGYSYNWTPGNPTGDGTTSVTGLTAGSWTCTVTDANSCTSTQTFNITAPSALSSAISTTHVACNGGNTGQLTASPAGGAGSYTYMWSPSGGNAASASGLSAGCYTVQVTDANGCTITASACVTEPTAISPNQMQNNISCAGGGNGYMMVSPTGGAGGYTYSWSPVANSTNTLNGTPAGSYTCTITDANSCTVTATFNLTEPAALSVSASQNDVGCNGGNTGDATVSVSGGTPGYSWSWSNGGTGTTESNLAAGSYTCTVTDANSCIITQVVTITEPTAVSVSVSQNDVGCNGGNTGDATVSVSGGTPGYSWSWSNGGTGATESNLAAGSYTCTVTDANSCITTQVVTITEPSAIAVTGTANNATGCTSNDGSIDLSVSGGSPLYTFAWSNSAATEDVSLLDGGVYSVIVTDINGCTETASFTIAEPGAPVVSYSEPMDTVCQATQAPFLLSGESPSGGSWSGPGVSGGSFDPVNASIGFNVITYTYTDVGGCTGTATDSVYVDICLGLAQAEPEEPAFHVYPNPNNGRFGFTHEYGEEPEVVIYNALGQAVQRIHTVSGDHYTVQIEIAGIYTLIIIPADGRRVSHRVIVSR